MEAIVAVYSDWGIGARGTQPIVIPEDRRRFAQLTKGATVIVGRRTLADFPGEDAVADTTRVNAAIEAMVREAPAQYLWIRRRFKRQPPGAPDRYARSGGDSRPL